MLKPEYFKSNDKAKNMAVDQQFSSVMTKLAPWQLLGSV